MILMNSQSKQKKENKRKESKLFQDFIEKLKSLIFDKYESIY